MFQADIDWSSKFPEYVSLEPIVIDTRMTAAALGYFKKYAPKLFSSYDYFMGRIRVNDHHKDTEYYIGNEEDGEDAIEQVEDTVFADALQLDKKTPRFIIVNVSRLYNGSVYHANAIIFDRLKKIGEFWEPHGWSQSHERYLKNFNSLFNKYGYEIISPTLSCPRQLGPQVKVNEDGVNRDNGYCSIWQTYFMVYKMLYPHLDGTEIAKRMTEGSPKDVYERFGKYMNLLEKAIDVYEKAVPDVKEREYKQRTSRKKQTNSKRQSKQKRTSRKKQTNSKRQSKQKRTSRKKQTNSKRQSKQKRTSRKKQTNIKRQSKQKRTSYKKQTNSKRQSKQKRTSYKKKRVSNKKKISNKKRTVKRKSNKKRASQKKR
jgi:hypothetical protein